MAETNPDDKGTKKSNAISQQLKRLIADLKELDGLLDSGFGRIKEITASKRRNGTNKKEKQALINVFKADQDKYDAAKESIKKVVELSTGLTVKNINNDVVNKIFEELAIIKKNSNFIISRAKLHEELGNKPGYIFTEKAHGYEGTMVFPDLSDFTKGLGNPKFAGDSSKPKSEKSILQKAIENRKKLFSDTNTSIRGSLENALIPKPRKNKEGVAKTTAAKKVREENINYLEKLKSGNLQESEYNKAASAIIKQATGFAKRKESPDFNPAKDTSKYSDDIEKQTGYTLDQILALNSTDNKNVGNIIIEGIKRKKEERFSSKISPSNITKSEAKDISEAVTNTSQSIEKESNASGPKPSERRDPKTGLLFLTREMKEAMGIGKKTALAEQVIGKTLAQQQEEASKNIKEEVIINELGAKITKIISPESSPITDIKPIESIIKTESANGGGKAKIPSLGGGGTGSGGTGGGSGGGGGTGGGSGSINIGEFKGIIDVRLVDISTSAIKQLDDLLVKVLGSSPIGNGGVGGGSTGDMDKLAQELKLSRESNEKIAKMYEARREKSVEEFKKKNAEKKAKKEKLDDPNSEESIAKAIRAKKRKERDAETIRKADPNSPESIAEKLKNAKAAISLEETIRKADPFSPESIAEKIRAAQTAANAAETIRKADPNSPESIAKKIKAAQAAQSVAETIRKADPNSPESLAKKIREEKRLQRDLETIRKADPNSPESIAKKKKEADAAEKEANKKLKSDRQSDPFRKRLQTIFKEGEQELSYLYAKVDSFSGWIPGFNDAILSARKKALETLREGYEAFDKKYAESGSAFKGMMASIKAMYSVSPFTVIVAGLTTIGVLLGKTIFNAAQKVNTQIKEISAELGTSNRQSYEMFKNAMNAQTQFENLHASLRDVMDAQKGILGDSGILLRTNDKALSAIADNAKNIGLSVESAGAFYENLRMKGAGDIEANNVMTASLELADKRGFSPQSIVDDIAQNAEFASKYFSKINKDSKSAHRNLIETNIQVKNLGLNFQKAAKMTQHLLSFEQSITAEVEASVALGTHVDIGKARELLLQDDIAGAMTQMMNAIPGGYEGFQNMDFAERQLSANALGLEVSELERSLYLREKIKLSNSEDLELAMKHDDYLRKIAGTNDELYRTELNKVQAAERYNTSIEKLSVSFRYALAPVLEAVVPIVDLLAGAINKLANIVKSFVGGITGANSDAAIGGGGIKTPDMYQMGGGALMATVMGGQLLKMMKGPVGGKIGEVVSKVRGGLDTLRGTIGTKTNPMYVVSLNGGADGGCVKGKYRSQAVLDRAQRIRNIRNANSPKPGLLKGFENNIKNLKAGNLIKDVIKTGGVTAAIFAGLDLYNRQQSGQSTAQAASGSISGLLGGLGGAAIGAAIGTFLLPGIGTILGGLVGGYYGQSSASTISDSHFDKNKSSSFTGGYGIYAGMGLNTAGSIAANNKPKATGTPVETSMVDMTPTTFKSPTNSLANISPNYGMTSSTARESVMVNRSSKSVATTAMMQKTVKEKEKTDDALIKEAQEQTKLMHEMIKKLNQPSLAFFNEEGRKQTANYIRVKSTP